MARPLAVALVLAAAVLWGTAGTVQELAVPDAAPTGVAALRCLLGGALLGLIAWRRGARVPATAVRPLIVAGLAMVVFQAGYLGGIRATGVAVGTLVAIGSAPVWAGVLAVALGRAPGIGWVGGTTLTVAGLALVVAPGGATVDPSGVVAAAVAGAGYAGYVAATAVVRERLDPFAMLAAVFLGAGAVLLLLPGGRTWGATDTVAVAGHLWLAVGAIGLAYLLFVSGLAGVDAPTATTLTLAEPLTATALAVLLVGETVSALGLTGVAALAAGLAVVARSGPAPTRLPLPQDREGRPGP